MALSETNTSLRYHLDLLRCQLTDLGRGGGVEVENVQHFTLLTGLSSHRQIVKAEEKKKTYDVKTTPVIGARAS